MKTSLISIGVGAGLLVGLTSCQNSSSGATGGYEEAIPMSELAIADGELPPWVLESDDTTQIAAGETTRNHYAIPEPDSSASASSGVSQNQPAVATSPQDDTLIEDGISAPLPAAPVATEVKNTAKPEISTVVASTKSTKGNKSTKSKNGKKVAKVNKPTLVVYKVRKGDNLSDIAARSHTTVAQIKKDSGLKSNIIHPGQIIKVRFIPKNYKGSNKLSTSAPAKTTSYTVKSGDTISGIAKKNGISTSALLSANGLSAKDAAKLRVGKKLAIPSSAKSSSKKSSTKKGRSRKK